MKKIETQGGHTKEVQNENAQTSAELQTLRAEITRLQNEEKETANWKEKFEAANRALETLTEMGKESEIEFNRQIEQLLPGRSSIEVDPNQSSQEPIDEEERSEGDLSIDSENPDPDIMKTNGPRRPS